MLLDLLKVLKEVAFFFYYAYVLRISGWSENLGFSRAVPTNTKVFCAVYDYAEKADLSKGY